MLKYLIFAIQRLANQESEAQNFDHQSCKLKKLDSLKAILFHWNMKQRVCNTRLFISALTKERNMHKNRNSHKINTYAYTEGSSRVGYKI